MADLSGPKKLTAMIVAAVLAIIAVAAIVVWAFPVFKVSTISVQGANHVDTVAAEDATGIALGENLVRIDARAAAAGVAQLPWVDSATVSRSFPSGVTVDIKERDVVAYVTKPDGPHLIDAKGKEFVIDLPPMEAVEITGRNDPNSDEVADAVKVIAAVPADIRADVASLDIEDAYSMTFRMKDERTVFWGANEDNANKARAFAAVLKMEGAHWDITNPELVTSR